MLAKAIAGEAGLPFLFCSGSDFVEVYVGRGAARVRELFEKARKLSPCIIFIDEIDAVAKTRGGVNSSDEREQTLNQLLSEIDGFKSTSKSGTRNLVIAATNRPSSLDKALLRSGRLDYHLLVPLPDTNGRKEILLIHLKRVKTSVDIYNIADHLSTQCDDFTGSDLSSLVNTAAMLAARRGSEQVDLVDFKTSLDKIMKSRIERKTPESDVNANNLENMNPTGDSGSLLNASTELRQKLLDSALSALVAQRLTTTNNINVNNGGNIDDIMNDHMVQSADVFVDRISGQVSLAVPAEDIDIDA